MQHDSKTSTDIQLYNFISIFVIYFSSFNFFGKDDEKLDSFHQKHLKYLIGKRFSHIITNSNLYKRCQTYSLSLFIICLQWKLFRHMLWLDGQYSPHKAMLRDLDRTDKSYLQRCWRWEITLTDNVLFRSKQQWYDVPFLCLWFFITK